MSRNWLAIQIWLVAIILVTSLSGAPAFAQGAATVRADPSTSSIQVNDTVNLGIKVDNIVNLSAFEIHLSFDPNVLEVTSLTNGGFVASDFTAQNTFDNAAGTIDYAIAQMNRPPVQGSGTLLNIAFRGKAAGSSQVTTHSIPAAPDGFILADQNGMSIQASWLPGMINVGQVTPTNTDTPTPTSTPTHTSTSGPSSTPTNTSTPGPSPTSTNTPTASSTPTPTATSTPTTPGIIGTHIVRWGEWLYCIGRAYKVSPWAIAKTNGIWWPYIIFPYQKLNIPNVPWTNIPAGRVCQAQFTVPGPTPIPTTPVPTITTATPITATSTPITATVTLAPATTLPPSSCRAVYIVQRGDTLYRIGLRYGVSYIDIARVNGISNPRLIYPGQQLCIP